MKGIIGVFAAIVTVALITAIVSSPRSAGIIRESGKAISGIYVGGIRAALGR